MTAPAPCVVCAKKTEMECSHVDCPNRRQVTARPIGDHVMTRDPDSLAGFGSCTVRGVTYDGEE